MAGSLNHKPLWVLALLDKNLSAVEFRVLMLLLRYQGNNGSAWPSQERLAADLALTPDGVRKITRRLAAKGWLRITYPDHTAPGRGVQYSITSPAKHPDGCMGEHPDDGLGDSENHPDSEAEITQTAKPRYKGRIHPRTHPSTARMVSYTPAFERFWTEYPRKLCKTEAFREWQAIGPDDAMIEKIILSVRAWKRSEQWAKDGGKFIVYPERFLKYRRFDDELPCSPEPAFGDSDWLPTEDEVDAVLAKAGTR